MSTMSQRGLEQFGAYEKARILFDLVVTDMQGLKADSRCFRLIAQQVGSADSICANIEEGYLLDEIIGILTSSIGTMKKRVSSDE